MQFLEKIRNKPPKVKKIILWSITSIIAVILFSIWFILSKRNLEEFFREEKNLKLFKIPKELEEKVKQIPEETKIPNIDIPKLEMSEEESSKVEEELKKELSEEEIKQLEEMMKQKQQ
jgi:hypothetical protein